MSTEGGSASAIVERPVSGPATGVRAETRRRPRLVRTSITLDDGHRVGVCCAGTGVPLVVVHGYSTEGFLYAQTLSRLVGMGFKVVAIDTAGHGRTQGLPAGGDDLAAYVDVLQRAVRALGIRRAVLAGHSMGGRLVADLAARHPDDVIAVLLLDAIVGDTWDRMVRVFRFAPLLLGGYAAALMVDSISPWSLVRAPSQAMKLARLFGPTLLDHLRHPERMIGPAVSVLRSTPSVPALEMLAELGVPVVVVHGELDVVVPMATARDTSRRAKAPLVVVRRGGHSWLLKDPETLPAVVRELLEGRLGRMRDRLLHRHGIDPATATAEQIEQLCLEPDALVAELVPGPARGEGAGAADAPRSDDTDVVALRRPRYRFSLHPPP